MEYHPVAKAAISKLVPVMLTAVPGVATDGVKFVMVGSPDAPAVTVKAPLLVAEPEGVETLIAPVVAPDGTLVVI